MLTSLFLSPSKVDQAFAQHWGRMSFYCSLAKGWFNSAFPFVTKPVAEGHVGF